MKLYLLSYQIFIVKIDFLSADLVPTWCPAVVPAEQMKLSHPKFTLSVPQVKITKMYIT